MFLFSSVTRVVERYERVTLLGKKFLLDGGVKLHFLERAHMQKKAVCVEAFRVTRIVQETQAFVVSMEPFVGTWSALVLGPFPPNACN